MLRIASNYTRLALTFAISIASVRIMAEIGSDAVLIYLLLISATGIAALLKFAMQNALVPALGLTLDGRGPHGFSDVYWTSFALGGAAGLVSLALFWAFWGLSGNLNLGQLSQQTIGVALLGTAVQACAAAIGIVFLDLILVDRRIVTYNLLLVLERARILIAALIVLALPQSYGIDAKVQLFYGLITAAALALQGITYFLAVRGKPQFALSRRPLKGPTLRWVAGFIGWSAVTVLAFSLFTRWPPLIVNWALGETLTLTLAIVLTLIGYQRQISMGLVIGLDAMIARLIGGDTAAHSATAATLVLRSTYILSVFAAFSVVLIGLFVQPILQLWFGDTLADTGWSPAHSASVFRIMSLGIAASIISEGWMKYLAGRGEMRVYAPPIFVAGLVNTCGILVIVWLLEPMQALRASAALFTLCFVAVHFGVVARKVAARLGVPWRALLTLSAVPAALALAAALPTFWLADQARGLATLGLAALGAGLALLLMPRVIGQVTP